MSGLCYVASGSDIPRACNCIGPQNGEPRCPCMMRGLVKRGDRWVQQHDVGPVRPAIPPITLGHGCVCPVGAEATCKGPLCPRKPIGSAA